MDQRTDTFADPAKVRAIAFEGTYYRSRGPLNATPSPQGRPVIIQAGASDRGQDFAARHAEAVFTAHATYERAAAEHGRRAVAGIAAVAA